MKKTWKKIVAVAALTAVAVTAAFSLAACTKEKTGEAFVGVVGEDTHLYFPYAYVKVNDKDEITDIELGEAFGPSGKITIAGTTDAPTVSYRNPWVPGFGSNHTTASSWSKGFFDGWDDASDKSAYIAENGKFISINGDIYETRVVTVNGKIGDAAVAPKAIQFVKKSDVTVVLNDKYIAEHIKWYIDAVKADGKVFECDKDGVKVENFKPADGAFLKNDLNSTYLSSSDANLGRGLTGYSFIKAMSDIAAFAKANKCVYETEDVNTAAADATPVYTKKIKNLTLTPHGAKESDVLTSPTTTMYLRYQVSYIEVVKKAYDTAKANKK